MTGFRRERGSLRRRVRGAAAVVVLSALMLGAQSAPGQTGGETWTAYVTNLATNAISGTVPAGDAWLWAFLAAA